MGESRQELLGWLNDLLQLKVTKVEQCGTGAALCQIYDSIYQDLPMSRVKFNVNTEYAYLQNFKILQTSSAPSDCFAKHQIDRLVPVESLIKCKMQDNLEFLQWTKRFWDQYFPGGEYDAVARRKGAGVSAAAPAPAPVTTSRTSGAGAARRGTTPTTAPARSVGAISAGGGTASAALKQELNTMKETVTGLERERDFYFSKLRDIELLLQQACDENPELEKDENNLIKQVQTILYSTEVCSMLLEGSGGRMLMGF
ncbi:MAG: hypothetical protein Q9209_002658 [Squamulea sp. 1 TL-2023]